LRINRVLLQELNFPAEHAAFAVDFLYGEICCLDGELPERSEKAGAWGQVADLNDIGLRFRDGREPQNTGSRCTGRPFQYAAARQLSLDGHPFPPESVAGLFCRSAAMPGAAGWLARAIGPRPSMAQLA